MIKKEEPTLENLMDEFSIEVPVDGASTGTPPIDVTLEGDAPSPDGLTEEQIAEAAKEKEEARIAAEGETPEAKEARLLAEKEDEEEAIRKKAEQAGGGSDFYKKLALKYIEKKKWADDLAVEDADGNAILVKDLEDIDEDTFFQIEEAIEAEDKASKEGKSLNLEGIDDRRKTLMDIIHAGGDLKEIFSSDKVLDHYLNPFENLDLEDEQTQANIYYNALIKHNKLDDDSAKTIVEKAKKDLTLDTKVKSFVEDYTSKHDAFVESKKVEIQAKAEEDRKKNVEFKKSLGAEYKAFNLKDTIIKKLTSLATTQKDGDFEIDSVYATKMEDPKEAAELVLFLTDKEMYLKHKLATGAIQEHKKFRQTIKLAPKGPGSKTPVEPDASTTDTDEFVMSVK